MLIFVIITFMFYWLHYCCL